MADDWGTSVPPELQVGDLSSQYIAIEGTVPPELTAFYNVHYDSPNIQASIRFVGITGNGIAYYYQVFGVNVSGTTGVYATGWVGYNGSVQEEYSATFNTSSAIPPQTIFGLVTSGIVQFGNNNPGTFQINWNGVDFVLSSINNWDLSAVGSDWQINNTSQGRGFVDTGHTTVTQSGIGSTPTQIIQSDAQRIFRNGRAFKLQMHFIANCQAAPAVLQLQALQGLTGTTVYSEITHYSFFDTNNVSFDQSGIFRNDSGVDVTDYISVLVNTTGTDLLNIFGSAFTPRWFHVEDIGSSSLFPWAHSMS